LRELRAHLAIDLEDTELVAWWNSSLRKMVDQVERVVREILGRMPVYALTNTNPLHFDYFMRHMSLLQRFDRVIASFHVGHRKSEAQLFQAAARLIGDAPENILFIDDLMTNVAEAKAVGYQAELCDRSSTRLRAILVQYGVF
jgi:HAD superfamily hydrolase (TIGR01509 family)